MRMELDSSEKQSIVGEKSSVLPESKKIQSEKTI